MYGDTSEREAFFTRDLGAVLSHRCLERLRPDRSNSFDSLRLMILESGFLGIGRWKAEFKPFFDSGLEVVCVRAATWV